MRNADSSNMLGYESLLRIYRETDLSQEKTRILSMCLLWLSTYIDICCVSVHLSLCSHPPAKSSLYLFTCMCMYCVFPSLYIYISLNPYICIYSMNVYLSLCLCLSVRTLLALHDCLQVRWRPALIRLWSWRFSTLF